MIFMFHPHGAAGTFAELRPRVLRRGRHYPVYERGGALQVGHLKCGLMRMHVDRSVSLHVQIRNLQRVLLDELAARFHRIAHQRREYIVRGYHILDAHLHEPTCLRIDGRVP